MDDLRSAKVDLELKVKELEDRLKEGMRRERARGKELEVESGRIGELEVRFLPLPFRFAGDDAFMTIDLTIFYLVTV